MTLSEYIYRNTPTYYPSMYLDGYTPNQILQAARQKLMAQYEESQQVDVIKIISEVKVK